MTACRRKLPAWLRDSSIRIAKEVVTQYNNDGSVRWRGTYHRYLRRAGGELDRRNFAVSIHRYDREWRLESEYRKHALHCQFDFDKTCVCGLKEERASQ